MNYKVFTAFSGYDSQMMALRRIESMHPGKVSFDLVGWSEIDGNAIAAHNAVFPEYADRNSGDISKVDWAEVPDFDLFTYSFPCFPAGAMVLTDNGYKTIESVTDSDKVLTHTNRWQKVVKPMRHSYTGKMVHFNAMQFDGLTCTAEHPLYVRRRRCKRECDQPIWMKAEDVTKDYYLGYAINTKSELPRWEGVADKRFTRNRKTLNALAEKFTDRDFWYLMGRYVGDGWKKNSKTGSGSGIIICCSDRNRQSLLDAFARLGYNVTINDDRTVTKVTVSSNELNVFVDRYGYKAHGKRVDIETMNLPVEFLTAFLDGYMDSDGCSLGNLHRASTVSRELVYGIAQCVAKCHHRPFSLDKTTRRPTTVIEGRTVNQRCSYSITWKSEAIDRDKAFYEDGYIWFPVNSIATEFVKGVDVFNMEVDEDNSYTVNGAIVHNCTDISNAGLRRGLSEGARTRSSLLWECRKAIEAKKPSFLLLENVAALVSKKFKPDFLRWLDWLDGQGYKTYWQKLNAKDYGVPQNRVRVFAVSIHRDAAARFPHLFPGGITYDFPKPFPLERRLKDVLLTYHDGVGVDEKYYLKTETVLRLLKWNESTTTNFKFSTVDEGGVAKTVLSGTSRKCDTYIDEKKRQTERIALAEPEPSLRGGGSVPDGNNPHRGLDTQNHGAATDCVIEMSKDGYASERPVSSEGVSRTLRYNGFRGGPVIADFRKPSATEETINEEL